MHQMFERQIFHFEIYKFLDRMKAASFALYPLDALPEHERDELLSECQVQGRKWAQLVSGPSSCFFHRGLSKFIYTEHLLIRTGGDLWKFHEK
jgi:hypothetical protein